MATKLTEDQKVDLTGKIREFLADECDMDVESIKDETDIMEDLKADSLVFLELIQEIQQDYKLDIELRQIGKYIVKHPVRTVGEATTVLFDLIERGEEIMAELDKESASI